MNITLKERTGFQPVTIEIEVTSREEFDDLMQMASMNVRIPALFKVEKEATFVFNVLSGIHTALVDHLPKI